MFHTKVAEKTKARILYRVIEKDGRDLKPL